jgi:NAD+ diphosphatase
MNDNVYGGGALDRAAVTRLDPQWLARRLADPASRLVPVWRAQSLIRRDGDTVRAHFPRVGQSPWLPSFADTVFLLGEADGATYFAVDLSAADEPATLPGLGDAGEFVDLRGVGALLPRREASLLAFARALSHWHRGHGFCGRCGAPTISRDGGYIRQCTSPDCGIEHYPRTDPAVIVLVAHGERCLLARQAKWPAGMFSILAGFVEPGESLEEAARREVMEEAGVALGRLRYHSSQPWPFPSSLMVGFLAEAEHTSALTIDHNELETAGWFTRDEIRHFAERGLSLPNADSIARRIIEDWLAAAP